MNPTNGKGDKRLHDRTKLKHEEMQDKWNRIFGKKDKSKDEEMKDTKGE